MAKKENSDMEVTNEGKRKATNYLITIANGIIEKRL